MGQERTKKMMKCVNCTFSHYYQRGLRHPVNERGREKLSVVCQGVEEGSEERLTGISR